MATSKQINPNGLAIVNLLTEYKGQTLAFAEIAHWAHVEPKTGYLTSAKKIAAERKMRIEKVEDDIKAEVYTTTVYPSGLQVEDKKEITLPGYRLVDAE